MIKALTSQFPLKHLKPRECHITSKPTLVSTILGSCLAVTMFDPATSIGGICHAFLPSVGEFPDVSEPCRFVDSAISFLLRGFEKRGVDRFQLEIKMFGGGEALAGVEYETLRHYSNRMRIGARNLARAREVLAREGLTVMSSDVGGSFGRKLLFLTHTGGAWVKRWGPSEVNGTIKSVIG